MAIIKLQGGLGNQLFQYAFGLYLAEEYKFPITYHSSTIRDIKSFTNRDLEITEFDNKLPIASDSEIKRYKKSPKYFERWERKLAQKIPTLFPRMIVQKSPHTPSSIIKDGYYDGYWQIYEYPQRITKYLQDKIKLNCHQTEKLSETINKIKNTTSVSIHIRRGDYINIPSNSKIFEICDIGYYNRAIRIIERSNTNSRFFIFTEDKEWAKSNFIGDKFILINGNSAIEDMLLMSFCKHNIIANSTYSWWAAFLNKNKNKTIIAPAKWYKGKMNEQTETLIPPTWKRI